MRGLVLIAVSISSPMYARPKRKTIIIISAAHAHGIHHTLGPHYRWPMADQAQRTQKLTNGQNMALAVGLIHGLIQLTMSLSVNPRLNAIWGLGV